MTEMLSAQFLSNHQGPEPIELDHRSRDSEGSDRTPGENVQRIRERDPTLCLRIGPNELPFVAFNGYEFS